MWTAVSTHLLTNNSLAWLKKTWAELAFKKGRWKKNHSSLSSSLPLKPNKDAKIFWKTRWSLTCTDDGLWNHLFTLGKGYVEVNSKFTTPLLWTLPYHWGLSLWQTDSNSVFQHSTLLCVPACQHPSKKCWELFGPNHLSSPEGVFCHGLQSRAWITGTHTRPELLCFFSACAWLCISPLISLDLLLFELQISSDSPLHSIHHENA